MHAYIQMYMYLQMHAIAIIERRYHEFEGGAYGRVWKEVRQGKNIIIKIQLKNKQKIRHGFFCWQPVAELTLVYR